MAPTQNRLCLPVTTAPRFALALHEPGIKEAALLVARFLSRFPGSSAEGCKTGLPTLRLFRARTSDTRQFARSERCLPITTAVHQQPTRTGLAGPRLPSQRTATNRFSGHHSEAPEGETRRRARMATVPAISGVLTGHNEGMSPPGMSLTAMGRLFPTEQAG